MGVTGCDEKAEPAAIKIYDFSKGNIVCTLYCKRLARLKIGSYVPFVDIKLVNSDNKFEKATYANIWLPVCLFSMGYNKIIHYIKDDHMVQVTGQ